MIPILNPVARFECTFGRGCDGVCCRNGRPLLYPEEQIRLDSRRAEIVRALRPSAQRAVLDSGFTSRRRKRGHPMARVVEGWCVFFNRGCVLHRMGLAEGDPLRYKPAVCALFPLDRDEHDQWYVRQSGYAGEVWDLWCLDPNSTTARAVDTLQAEIRLATRFTAELPPEPGPPHPTEPPLRAAPPASGRRRSPRRGGDSGRA